MYERFRNEFVAALPKIPKCEMDAALRALDRIAAKYEFRPKETALAVYMQELPEVAKTYLVIKKLAGLSDATLGNYRTVLQVFFRSTRKTPEQITSNDIRLFLYGYQAERNISMKTLDKYRECICGFFRWACDEEYIPTNPAKKILPIRYESKPREALSPIELEQLRAACKTLREKAIIEVLYSTGCRVSELTAIKVSDIDWVEKSVHLFGKGRKHRTSFLSARAEVAVREYLEARTDACEFLITTERKPYRGMQKDGIEKIVRQIAARTPFASEKVVTPHILRHTTATTALRRGMPIADISKLLGHEAINTTMVYAKTSLADVKAGHGKYIN